MLFSPIFAILSTVSANVSKNLVIWINCFELHNMESKSDSGIQIIYVVWLDVWSNFCNETSRSRDMILPTFFTIQLVLIIINVFLAERRFFCCQILNNIVPKTDSITGFAIVEFS